MIGVAGIIEGVLLGSTGSGVKVSVIVGETVGLFVGGTNCVGVMDGVQVIVTVGVRLGVLVIKKGTCVTGLGATVVETGDGVLVGEVVGTGVFWRA